MKKNQVIWPTAAVLIAIILAIGGAATARSLRPAVAIHKVPGPSVTVTARPATIVRDEIKWRTRTITASGVPCLELDGKTWFAGGANGGSGAISTTCTIVAVQPYSSGMIEVVTADGKAAEYYSPAGGGN